MKRDIYIKPDGYDHDGVQAGKGSGYMTRSKPLRVCMERCFSCGRENYALAVPSGHCAWCKFDANDQQYEDEIHPIKK